MTKKVFNISSYGKCNHRDFKLDETRDVVVCGICSEDLSPLWVLKQFSKRESWTHRRITEAREALKKAESKNRCKCEHCGKMTKVQK